MFIAYFLASLENLVCGKIFYRAALAFGNSVDYLFFFLVGFEVDFCKGFWPKLLTLLMN